MNDQIHILEQHFCRVHDDDKCEEEWVCNLNKKFSYIFIVELN